MTTRALIFILAGLTLGCGPPRGASIAPPPAPGPAALLLTWYYDLPQRCFEQAREGRVDTTDCALNPGAPDEAWVEGELLVPLGCFLPERGLVEADACPEPLGDAPAYLDDAPVRLDFPMTVTCMADGSLARGYVTEVNEAERPLAIWPLPWEERLIHVDPEAEEPLEPAARGHIEADIYSAIGADVGPLQIEQVVHLDVDGDGELEPLVSVFVSEPGDMTTYRYSALMLVDEGEVLALRRSEYELFQVVGASDLDGDGHLEIITLEAYYEGSAYVFWTLDGRVLGAVGCGA